MVLDCAVPDENVALKTQLLRLAAAYDRGFGASAAARQQVDTIIRDLEQCYTSSSSASNVAVSTILLDKNNSNNNSISNNGTPSLIGTWRLIWTTALDVLSLQASPLFTAGAIHQVFEYGGVVTNVIDLVPRVSLLLPIPSPSGIRARVTTRARAPVDAERHRNRVGLVFESVTLQPQPQTMVLLGGIIDASALLNLPSSLTLNLPRWPDSWTAATGYFDIAYLDSELLIIRQNAPGGLFALLRVDSMDVP